ncbi:hypothetical protein DFH29DRAFT_999542 [Suillus ampliporus]|nr:hypothetical protein DFH29DRAFT_999542 [Suillus ampliporus]
MSESLVDLLTTLSLMAQNLCTDSTQIFGMEEADSHAGADVCFIEGIKCSTILDIDHKGMQCWSMEMIEVSSQKTRVEES